MHYVSVHKQSAVLQSEVRIREDEAIAKDDILAIKGYTSSDAISPCIDALFVHLISVPPCLKHVPVTQVDRTVAMLLPCFELTSVYPHLIVFCQVS